MSEKLARDAFEIGQRRGRDNASAGLFGLQMFALSRERGKLKELEPLVRMFLRDNSLADTWRPGLAVIYAELGRADEARLEFESLAADDFGDLPHDSLWMGTVTYLVDICVFLGDKPRASILYRLLVPFDGRDITIAYVAVCYGAISRYLGMLSTALEKWDDAARHFEDALTMNARMDASTWLGTPSIAIREDDARARSSNRSRARLCPTRFCSRYYPSAWNAGARAESIRSAEPRDVTR